MLQKVCMGLTVLSLVVFFSMFAVIDCAVAEENVVVCNYVEAFERIYVVKEEQTEKSYDIDCALAYMAGRIEEHLPEQSEEYELKVWLEVYEDGDVEFWFEIPAWNGGFVAEAGVDEDGNYYATYDELSRVAQKFINKLEW